MKKAAILLITSLINYERISKGLNIVSYNYNLHNYLYGNITNNGSWFYESTNELRSWEIEGQRRFCDLRGCFLKPLGYNYMFRDTYKDSIPIIFRYRLGQRDCNRTVFKDGDPCSWFYAYYPVLMQPGFKSFACKSLNYQGRFVPDSLKDHQFKSFWCYFNDEKYFLNSY